MDFSIKAASEPECQSFLKLKKGDTYYTLDEFIQAFHSDTEEFLNDCNVLYRGSEKTYPQMIKDYTAFSNGLEFYSFSEPAFVMDKAISASIYFAKKARDCLQIARFFAMKSALLFDTNFNLHWSQGYIPHYLFRCIYFGTASTWYSNAYDHVLQIAYWGFGLYTSVKDRDDKIFDKSWDAKKISSLCTYEFVVTELKTRGLADVRKILTSCSSKMEEVRLWANYIKHKGGIKYKHLEAPPLYHMTLKPIGGGAPVSIDDFNSPIEVDIDDDISKLKQTHIAIHKCLKAMVTAIDFDAHSVEFINKEEN